jgi:hypothetical protein
MKGAILMKNTISIYKLSVIVSVVLLLFCTAGFAENIDPNDDGSQYAWGENTGWINLEPGGDGGPGVEVTDDALTGYLWAENTGWIHLNPPQGGVSTTATETSRATGGPRTSAGSIFPPPMAG